MVNMYDQSNQIGYLLNFVFISTYLIGGVAQMVERSLSMREVPGSIPGTSSEFFTYFNQPMNMENIFSV